MIGFLRLVGLWAMAGLVAAQQPPQAQQGSTGTVNEPAKAAADVAYPSNGWPVFPTLPLDKWVGQRIVFRPYEGPERLKRWWYGWVHREGSPPTTNASFEEVSGKTGVIVAIRTDNAPDLPTITVALDGTGARYVGHVDNGSLASIAFLDEIDRAKKALIGRRAWILASWIYDLKTYHADSQTYSSIPARRLSPVTIVDVVVSTLGPGPPVRLILRNEKGEEGFVEAHLSATNVMEGELEDGRWRSYLFSDLLSVSDPKNGRNWPKAVWDAIEAGEAAVGMTAEQVRVAIGDPASKQQQRTAAGITLHWTYQNGMVVHFAHGVVTRITPVPPTY